MAKMEILQLASGSLVGDRFEVIHAAGSGGMATIYRARDRNSGDIVALKLLHGGTSAAIEVERFNREAQLLSELHHQGIVSYVAHGQTQAGQQFLAMQWLDGEDLGQRLARGPLSVQQAVELLIDIADALAVAHHRGVIHRDRTHKHKICLQRSHRALHERRTDYACTPLPHCPS